MGFHEAKGKEDSKLKAQSGQTPKAGECQVPKELGFPGSAGKKTLEMVVDLQKMGDNQRKLKAGRLLRRLLQ